MADNEAHLHEKEQSLNFLSASFDPLKAIYTKDLKPPIPSIQIFNNLGEYARVVKEGKPKTATQKQPRKTPTLANKRARNLKPEYKPPDISTRLKVIASTGVAPKDLLSREKGVGIFGQDDDDFSKGQKENALVFGRGRTRKKKYMNVLEKMDACATGPLSILCKCLDKRYKVQVWIRKYKGLRSVLTGYVIAFDKHMNLALMDVDEVYTTEENQRNECSTEEEKTTKKKKKKKKKRKTKNQANNSLLNTDKVENVGITPLLDKIHEKPVAGLKENSIPHLNESTTIDETDGKSVTELKDISVSLPNSDTTEQNAEAGLSQVVDLNRPFESLKSDYSRKETVIKSQELATMKGGTSSSLGTAKECDKTGMLSTEQLAILSKQWKDHEQESRQQEIEAVDLIEQPMDQDSEQTGYLFSHELNVRVPAYEDIESQDMEFTVVGIFHPASTAESNQDKSVLLPDNLEINVPLSFTNSIEEVQGSTRKLDKPVIPDTELVLDDVNKTKELNAHSLQADNKVLPVLEPGDSYNQLCIQLDKPVLHNIYKNGDSEDQAMQLDKPVLPSSDPVLQDISVDGDLENNVLQIDKPILPVSESIFHGIDIDVALEPQALKLDKPEMLASELVLHGQDANEQAKDKIVQSDDILTPMEESLSNIIDKDGNEAENLPADTPEKPLICEGSSNEGEPLCVCNFSDGICTDKPIAESLPASGCGINENSIISERNTKEREISQEISASNPENYIIESFKSGKFGINEKEIRSEKVLKESYPQIHSREEEKSTCLQEGSKSTGQEETEGSLMEEGSEYKNHEKSPTFNEDQNSGNDNGMKCEKESENIGNIDEGIRYVDLECEIEHKDSKTLTDLSSIMAMKEQLAGSMKEHNETSQQESSGESKTVAQSVNKGPGLEESSSHKSLPADGTNAPARDDSDGSLIKSKESIAGKPILEEKSDSGRSHLDGNDKGTEDTVKNTLKNTVKSSVGRTRESVVKGAQKAEEENTMESEKEEGEISSSDEGEADQSIKSRVELSKHVDTNSQQKKLSVWERLGDKDRDKNEESTRRSSRENYENKKREEKQETGRNKDDKKKAEDRRQSTSRDNKQREESERKKEGKEKRDLKTKERRGTDESVKTVRKDKVTVMKRTGKERTSAWEDLITGRDMQSQRRREKEAEKPSYNTDHTKQSRKHKDDNINEKAREGRSSSHDKEGQRKEVRQPSKVLPRNDIPAPHSYKEETKSTKGKTETKSSSTEMKKNEGEQTRRSSDDEKHPRRSKEGKADRVKVDRVMKSENKKEERKERTTKPMSEHASENGSRNMPLGTKARRESIDRKERKGSASTSTKTSEPHGNHDSEKFPRNKRHGTQARRESIDRKEMKGSASTSTKKSEPHGNHDSEKFPRNKRHGTQARRESIDRKEMKGSASTSTKRSEPQGDQDRKNGSRNTRHDIEARSESIDRKSKKESGAVSTSTRKAKPQDNQPNHMHSSRAKQLILKEVSTNHNAKEVSTNHNAKESTNHNAKESTNHNAKEISKGKKTGETRPEHHSTAQKKTRNPKREELEQKEQRTVMSKTSDQPQQAQCCEGKCLPDEKCGKNTKVNKAQEAQSGNSSTGSVSLKVESGKRVEEMKKTYANRLGASERDTSSERKSAGENLKTGENPKTEKTEMKPKKVGLLPTPVLGINKRTNEVGMWSGSNRQSTIGAYNTSIRVIRNEKQVLKSPETCKKRKLPIGNGMGGRVKRWKRTEKSEESISLRKDKSNSEPEVKSPKNTTKSESRALKKDIGGESSETIGTPRQTKVGKGKILYFKRRHVNQLFVRGDNIMMIGYAV